MKTGPKWAVNKSHDLLYTELFIPALFFQTAVSRERNELDQIRWRQNARNEQGFHPLFHESDLAQLFHPLSASFLKESTFSGCSRWAKVGHYGPKYAPGTQ